jgi:leucyl aminopeptidase
VKEQPAYPKKFKYEENVWRLIPQLSWDNIKNNLEHYSSSYNTRFSETETGTEAAEWLFSQVADVVKQSRKNGVNRLAGRAPGVDDNGSGSFTILEAMRVLLTDKDFGPSKLQNTIEFHW